jgi:hypothetical protein
VSEPEASAEKAQKRYKQRAVTDPHEPPRFTDAGRGVLAQIEDLRFLDRLEIAQLFLCAIQPAVPDASSLSSRPWRQRFRYPFAGSEAIH